MRNLKNAVALGVLALGMLGLYGVFEWTVNRIYVHEGESLLLRYKGPLIFGSRTPAKLGHYAQAGETGMLEQLGGPGRHFYCPIWWERRIIKDVVVEPGQIGLVKSNLGDDLPAGEFLVSGDIGNAKYRGILRKVLGPGRYRINTYGYEVQLVDRKVDKVGEQEKVSGWVDVPTGYVGVVTQRWDDNELNVPAGILPKVLPPGLYPVNPIEQQVDIVEVGYRETSITVSKKSDGKGQPMHDKSGEPLALLNTGIGFPSNDGFPIQLDFTSIWGVMPNQAPEVIRTFGGITAVEQKVILPQAESICRNNGSKMGAVDLLVGQSRQQFQETTQNELKSVLKEKNLEFLYGLVRHIYIPQEVRTHIQQGYVADELTLTREQEKLTATTEANLREAERKVELEQERIRVETAKQVANVIAEGQKASSEIAATTKQQVAQIDREIAELDAKKTVFLGEAEAMSRQLQQEAEAQRFQLAIQAFGDPGAYNRWQFAEGLPESIDLRLFYAGQGTLWTDLKNIVPTLSLTAGEAPAIAKPADAQKSIRSTKLEK